MSVDGDEDLPYARNRHEKKRPKPLALSPWSSEGVEIGHRDCIGHGYAFPSLRGSFMS